MTSFLYESSNEYTPLSKFWHDQPHPYLNEATAEQLVFTFIRNQPTRSWIGKYFFDAATSDPLVPQSVVTQTGELWENLIQLEAACQKLTFATPELADQMIRSRIGHVVSANLIWDDITKVIKDSAFEMVIANPSYLRSRAYDPGSFMRMILNHIVLANHLLTQLVCISKTIPSITRALKIEYLKPHHSS